MFTILFGLSMDYEVFLLSRIREEYLARADNRASVVAGLSSTARVITSAALIMVMVFLGFAADSAVLVKMLGVGLATAVALDATLVRLVLVPATMALLGRVNWWLPRWLDRLLPHMETHPSRPQPTAPAHTRAAGQRYPLGGAGVVLKNRGDPSVSAGLLPDPSTDRSAGTRPTGTL
jgi:RND superfamily putative drug exporter